ncbi:hypothetical protein I4J37_06580 [Corynebacterium belfantii]|uniref:hypothetical protein n=1 Tax=Corynebacterium belfantii TaxID=2014537 RepID=UPI0018D40113|nr:hypothetical protein [Corynebacterium belfantii]MBG9319436.1 hypothetical protein [Corynebacterium belfantii]
MNQANNSMPVAISQFGEDVETSREPQNARAIKWLLQQPGGAITVVTPRKDVDSAVIKSLIARRGVTHLSWRGLSTNSLRGRILFAWPDRKHLNDLWGLEADALAVIEWVPQETKEWIEDNRPVLLLHDQTKPYTADAHEQISSERLPNGVEEILENIALWAAGYSGGLKWNEEDKFKADMMNRPQRWSSVTVAQVRAKCRELGMRPNDVDTVAKLLQRRKDGHSFRVTGTYKDYYFNF